jgi:hypothetical protein
MKNGLAIAAAGSGPPAERGARATGAASAAIDGKREIGARRRAFLMNSRPHRAASALTGSQARKPRKPVR